MDSESWVKNCLFLLSLPVWERGLKSNVPFTSGTTNLSLPVWERGLKCLFPKTSSRCPQVAPRVGAWIEICCSLCNPPADSSLPVWERGLKLTGVMTETGAAGSLPVWERGLKCFLPNQDTVYCPSLPVWERGLKFTCYRDSYPR